MWIETKRNLSNFFTRLKISLFYLYEFQGLVPITMTNSRIRDIDTLPPSDSILLDSLAHACIYEVGGIQALAQSIDRYIDGSDEVYSTYDSCTFPASRIQTTHVFDDLSKANSLKVYPNPANSILNIEVGDGYEKAIINILDASGRRVMSTTTFKKRTRTDISALGSGIYFISLTGHGFSPVYQKFVKTMRTSISLIGLLLLNLSLISQIPLYDGTWMLGAGIIHYQARY